jgi:hypothetical protein
MGSYTYSPRRWDSAAAAAWSVRQHDRALDILMSALDSGRELDPDAFIQPGYYLFQLNRFAESAAVLNRGASLFPDHPMVLLSLGGSLTRAQKGREAIPVLERFLALGYMDGTAFDALAAAFEQTGDLIKAQLFGTLALNEKDKTTADRRGQPPLREVSGADERPCVIAFSLWGNNPRYLRGALQNLLAAQSVYPGWTCRFYVDSSVDAQFLETLAGEGADIRQCDGTDSRDRLCRRFLVADDASLGRFLVRDCDSVVGEREAAAVAEWIESGLPFHVMRDWYTHTDPMLAGMWGGIAGVFPDLAGQLESFRNEAPAFHNWDQWFLGQRVWPAIRDHALIHDRCFGSYRARPFPTPTPNGREHVGQNEYVSGPARQASTLASFAEKVPALRLAGTTQAIGLRLRSKLD